MAEIKHKFVSAIPDGSDATVVRPSNWNDTHAITGGANKLAGYDNTGNFIDVNIGSGVSYAGGTLSATGTGVTSVTGTAPIASSGGTTPAISIAQATTSVGGYLSSTDWNTFNNKQAALTLTTTGSSGAATLTGATLNIPNYSGGSSITLETNGNPNGDQSLLNLVQGADMSIGDDGFGNITFTPIAPSGAYVWSNDGANNIWSYNAIAANQGLIPQGNLSFGNNSGAQGGDYNVAIGVNVMPGSLGTYNVGVGYSALGGMYNGSQNVGLGYFAGSSIAFGTGNIFVGYNADLGSDVSNCMDIGNIIFATNLNATNAQVGVGNTAPAARLHVSPTPITIDPPTSPSTKISSLQNGGYAFGSPTQTYEIYSNDPTTGIYSSTFASTSFSDGGGGQFTPQSANATINYSETGYVAFGYTYVYEIYALYGGSTVQSVGYAANSMVGDNGTVSPYGVDVSWSAPSGSPAPDTYLVLCTGSNPSSGQYQLINATAFTDNATGWSNTPPTYPAIQYYVEIDYTNPYANTTVWNTTSSPGAYTTASGSAQSVVDYNSWSAGPPTLSPAISFVTESVISDGTTEICKLGGELGFFGATPYAQYATTGTTAGFTANPSGNLAYAESTFTGGIGSSPYTIGDIVLALKNYGLMAA